MTNGIFLRIVIGSFTLSAGLLFLQHMAIFHVIGGYYKTIEYEETNIL